MQEDTEELERHLELRDELYNSDISPDDLPAFRVGKLQLGLKQLDLLVLDNVIEDFPIRQMRIRLGAVLKKLPQRDAQSPADQSNSHCKSQHR